MEKLTKLKVAGLTDPVCPKCEIAMFAVSAMTLEIGQRWKHFARCPKCFYETEAK
jgi:hypothetical protein